MRGLTLLMVLVVAGPVWAELPTLALKNFDDGSLTGWKFTDDNAWKLIDRDAGKALALITRQSKYTPKVRSPFNIALLNDVVVDEFVLDVKIHSPKDTGAHRDACLFFGYQDPEHFYYVHLGKKGDAHAHSIFIVNNEPRLSIAAERTDGTPWTDGWHHARIERNPKTGSIRVYFDDMTKPIMQATDARFAWGKVGIGSFDDEAVFDDFSLKGQVHATK